eukprot:6376682-Pyramimonas_sp.AAC.2
MSEVVISEQQHTILDIDRATTARVYVTAAAKRAVVVKEDDLLAKVDSGEPRQGFRSPLC